MNKEKIKKIKKIISSHARNKKTSYHSFGGREVRNGLGGSHKGLAQCIVELEDGTITTRHINPSLFNMEKEGVETNDSQG